MSIHPHLAQVLEVYDPERLYALLIWLNSELKDMFSLTDTPTPIETTPIQSLTPGSLDLDDLIQFSILNEFGPGFSEKPAFPLLQAQVYQKLSLN